MGPRRANSPHCKAWAVRKMLQVGYTVVSDAAEAIRVKANDWTLKSKAR